MSKMLNEIRVHMTVEELKEKIRGHYKSLDPSITEVEVEHTFKHIDGEWSEAWQRCIGGHSVNEVKVNITREVTVCGKKEIVKDYECLNETDLINILEKLSKEEEFKPYMFSSCYGEEGRPIAIKCERRNSDEKSEGNGTFKNILKEYAKKAIVGVKRRIT